MKNLDLIPKKVFDEACTGDGIFDYAEMLEDCFPKETAITLISLDFYAEENFDSILTSSGTWVHGLEPGKSKAPVRIKTDDEDCDFTITLEFDPKDWHGVWDGISKLYWRLYHEGRYNDPDELDSHFISLSFEVVMENWSCRISHFLDDSTR